MKRAAVFFLALISLAAAAVSAQAPVHSADANKRGLTDKDFPRQVKLAENVYAYEILPGRGGNAQPDATRVTTNSMVVVTSEGVLIADTQGSIAGANQLLEEVKKLTPQPIKYIVICTEHTDHTNGISAFPQTATYISSPFTQNTFRTQANDPSRQPNAPKVVVPGETVSDKKVIKLGNTEIDVMNIGRSHTGGDLAVYLPREKVLWMGETFNSFRFPTLRTGYPSEWVKTIDVAQHMDVNYYAGAHGFIDDAATMKASLAEYRKALETLIAEAKRLHQPGANPDEAFKQANFGPYAMWTDFAQQAPTAFKRAWDELDGKLK